MIMKKVITVVGILILLISVLPNETGCALSCSVWVDGGCGSTHRIGSKMNIYFQVNTAAYIELWLTYPDGSKNQMAYGTVCGGRTYYVSGEIGEPPGKRIALLKAWAGSEYDSDTCIYYGGEAPGSIRVTSNPSGAKCYLDGTYRGTTPLTIGDVSAGEHSLKLTRSGYEDWSRTVRVYSNQTTSVSAELQELLGSIKVTSDPSGAKCYLDGKYKGTTPLTIGGISTGNHEIQVEKESYYDWKSSVNVSAGKTSSIHASLEMMTGFLDVKSNTKADVYIDGTYQGETPLQREVSVGSHQIKISANKYYDHIETVVVTVGQYTYVDAPLTEKPGSVSVESTPSNAEVYLDGKYQGRTPLTISEVKSGTYTLLLTNSGYYDWRTSVTVYPDETSSVDASMHRVFWKTWYFYLSVVIAFLCAGFLLYRKKRVIRPGESPVAKLKTRFEEVTSRLMKAPFFSIDNLSNIVLGDEKNLCLICNDDLGNPENGQILECTYCKDKGPVCRFHSGCWERFKEQQEKNSEGMIRCCKPPGRYISEAENIKPVTQAEPVKT
jgi:hypothetical protein